MDSDMLDTIILPMDMLLIMARGLLMPSPRLMLILIFSMVDIMDLVMAAMVFTILPMVVMLTMERDLPMLILTFSTVDITDLDMPDMDFTILPMVLMLTMARGQLMLRPRLIPMCMVDTMDLVDTVVMADMDLDIVSTMDKQRISPH